jgi:hypothetical protein
MLIWRIVGKFNFGYIDTAAYIPPLNYVPVNKASGYWQIIVGGYALGTGANVDAPFTAIADTGTTLMLLPSTIVKAYYAQILGSVYDSAQAAYTFPCSAAMPTFTLVIGTSKLVIPTNLIKFAQVSNTMCYGGIQSSDGIGFAILGDVALKAGFFVFDEGNSQLGFAAKP